MKSCKTKLSIFSLILMPILALAGGGVFFNGLKESIPLSAASNLPTNPVVTFNYDKANAYSYAQANSDLDEVKRSAMTKGTGNWTLTDATASGVKTLTAKEKGTKEFDTLLIPFSFSCSVPAYTQYDVVMSFKSTLDKDGFIGTARARSEIFINYTTAAQSYSSTNVYVTSDDNTQSTKAGGKSAAIIYTTNSELNTDTTNVTLTFNNLTGASASTKTCYGSAFICIGFGNTWTHDAVFTFAPSVTSAKAKTRLSFNLSGGTSTLRYTEKYYGDALTAISTTPIKTGYLFDGYYSEANGEGTCYFDRLGAVKTNFNQVKGAVAYANWTPMNYGISYQLNGGVVDGLTRNIDYDQNFQLPVPKKAGSVFTGWSLSNNVNTTTARYSTDGTTWKQITNLEQKFTEPVQFKNLVSENGKTVVLTANFTKITGIRIENTKTSYKTGESLDVSMLSAFLVCEDGEFALDVSKLSFDKTVFDKQDYPTCQVEAKYVDGGEFVATLDIQISKVIIEKPAKDESVFVYNEEEQTFVIAPSEFYVIYGNKQTDAGEHEVIVSLKEDCEWADGTTENLVFKFVINKAVASEDMTAAYTNANIGAINGERGREYSLPPLPKGAAYGELSAFVDEELGRNSADYFDISTLVVENNVLAYKPINNNLEIGTYPICAIEVNGADNYEDYVLQIYVRVVDQKIVLISGVEAKDKVYDSFALEPNLSDFKIVDAYDESIDFTDEARDSLRFIYTGTLANGMAYESSEAPTAAGEYSLELKFEEGANFRVRRQFKYDFEILKATFDVTGLSWNYSRAFTFDGNAHSVEIVGELPNGLELEGYTDNTSTNVGKFVAKAIFNFDSDNFNAPMLADCNWQIQARGVDVVWSDVELEYNGLVQNDRISAHYVDINGLAVILQLRFAEDMIGAKTYTVVAAGEDDNYSLQGATKRFTIAKARIAKPAKVEGEFVYSGEYQTYNLAENENYAIVNNRQKNAGTYKVIVTINDSDNFMWEDGTINNLNFDFTIGKVKIEVPQGDSRKFVYSGQAQTFEIAQNAGYEILNNTQTDAGRHEVIVVLKDKVNFEWASGDGEDLTFTFVIEKLKVSKPLAYQAEFEYNGQMQEYVVAQNERYKISNNLYSEAGPHKVEVALLDTDNTCWEDETIEPVVFNFEIKKASYDMSAVAFEDGTVTQFGQPVSIFISGNLPVGKDGVAVTVSYRGNGKVESGVYEVEAIFETASNNYFVPEPMKATLTILWKQADFKDPETGESAVKLETENGQLPDVKLEVEIGEVLSDDILQILNSSGLIGEGEKVYRYYLPKLVNGGQSVEIEGEIKLYLRIPNALVEKDFKLFEIVGDQVRQVEFEADENGFVRVSTEALSRYIFVAKEEAPKVNLGLIIGGVLSGLALLLAVGHVIGFTTVRRKRKNKSM